MADKQIRVTTDTSGIERFRTEVNNLYRDLEKIQQSQERITGQDADRIYRQFNDLKRTYNEVGADNNRQANDDYFNLTRLYYQNSYNRVVENQRNQYLAQQRSQQLDNQRGVGDNSNVIGNDSNSRKSILEQIRDTLNKIFNKNQTVGGRPLQQKGGMQGEEDSERSDSFLRSDVQGGLQSIASGDFVGGFGKLMGLAGLGIAGAGLIKAFQDTYRAQTNVYRAGSSIERELERLDVWSWLPFSSRGRNVETTRENLAAYWNNRNAQYQAALMNGIGIDEAFNYQIRGSQVLGKDDDPKYSRAMSKAIQLAGSFGAGGAALGTAVVPGIGSAIGGGIGAFAGFLGGAGLGA